MERRALFAKTWLRQEDARRKYKGKELEKRCEEGDRRKCENVRLREIWPRWVYHLKCQFLGGSWLYTFFNKTFFEILTTPCSWIQARHGTSEICGPLDQLVCWKGSMCGQSTNWTFFFFFSFFGLIMFTMRWLWHSEFFSINRVEDFPILIFSWEKVLIQKSHTHAKKTKKVVCEVMRNMWILCVYIKMAIPDYCFVGQSIVLLLSPEYMKSIICLMMDSQVVKKILEFPQLGTILRKKVIIVNQRRLVHTSDTIGLANFARPNQIRQFWEVSIFSIIQYELSHLSKGILARYTQNDFLWYLRGWRESRGDMICYTLISVVLLFTHLIIKMAINFL